eukprot:6081010-Prymnesium_polylepis.2
MERPCVTILLSSDGVPLAEPLGAFAQMSRRASGGVCCHMWLTGGSCVHGVGRDICSQLLCKRLADLRTAAHTRRRRGRADCRNSFERKVS